MASSIRPPLLAGSALPQRDPVEDEPARPRPATLEVEVIARHPMPRLVIEPVDSDPRARAAWTPARVIVFAAVLLYVGAVLLLPLCALASEAARLGIAAILRGITSAAALARCRVLLARSRSL
ncbi:MAG TPA: hypothetical protein VH762_13915, partial [Gemmatimonadaceae bacterium]